MSLSISDVLRSAPRVGTLTKVDEEEGIYRGEVMAIMGALADISSDTMQILAILRGEDDDEEGEDEEMDA